MDVWMCVMDGIYILLIYWLIHVFVMNCNEYNNNTILVLYPMNDVR